SSAPPFRVIAALGVAVTVAVTLETNRLAGWQKAAEGAAQVAGGEAGVATGRDVIGEITRAALLRVAGQNLSTFCCLKGSSQILHLPVCSHRSGRIRRVTDNPWG